MPVIPFPSALLGLYMLFGPGAPFPPTLRSVAGGVDVPEGCELLLVIREGDPDHVFLAGLPPVIKTLDTLSLSATGVRHLTLQTGLLGLTVAEPMDDAALGALASLTLLEDLGLTLSTANEDAAVPALAGLGLTNLVLHGDVSSGALRQLAAVTSVEGLEIDLPQVTQEAVELIDGWKSLERVRISLASEPHFEDDTVKGLVELGARLEELVVTAAGEVVPL